MARHAHRSGSAYVQEVLSRFSNSELQAGLSIQTPQRRHITPATPDEWPYEIFLGPKKLAGTRIPSSTLSKFRSGEWTPGKRTIEKLKAFEDRANYARLRASGASVAEAKRRFRSPKVKEYIAEYRAIVSSVAKGKKRDIAYITWGMMQSEKTLDDFEKYVRDKHYPEPDEEFLDDDEWDDHVIDETEAEAYEW